MARETDFIGKIQKGHIVFNPAIIRTYVHHGRGHPVTIRYLPLKYVQRYEDLTDASENTEVRISSGTVYRAMHEVYSAKKKKSKKDGETTVLTEREVGDLMALEEEPEDDTISDVELEKLFKKEEHKST